MESRLLSILLHARAITIIYSSLTRPLTGRLVWRDPDERRFGPRALNNGISMDPTIYTGWIGNHMHHVF